MFLGEWIHTYLQVFLASQVGLFGDSRAWEDSQTFFVNSQYPSPVVSRHFGMRPRLHFKFSVTYQVDFFAISLHLIHMTLTGGLEDRNMGGSLTCLTCMIMDAFETTDGSPLEFANIHVPKKYTELAFFLFSSLPTFLLAIKECDPWGIRLWRKHDGVGTNTRVYMKKWATEV